MSPYEKDLQADFESKLKKYLQRPKVRNRLLRTNNVNKEIRKFAKIYDRRNLTEFHDIFKGGKSAK